MYNQTTALSDSQLSAVERLRKYKVGALFMEPGTGKTRAACELINSVEGIDYILWLTPFQTKKNLNAEIKKWGYRHVDIQGIESLSNSGRLYLEMMQKIAGADKPFMVVDESLKIKNFSAVRSKRIISLGRQVHYKLILNGTPLSRNLLDLWAQMEFLSPKILKMSLNEYKNTFCEYLTVKKWHGNYRLEKEIITGYHNIDYLYRLIEPFVFEAGLQMGKKRKYIDLPWQLTAGEMDEHEKLKEKYLDNELMEIRNNNIFLEITTRLQHNYSLSPEKISVVKKVLKDRDPAKVLVYARFIETQRGLCDYFPQIKVMSWQRHAFGLNLQKFNTVVFFDKVWDYALREQAEHRVYRLGQTSDCVFYDLTGNVGLEKMMNRNIKKKGALLNYFKNKSVEELKKIL